MQVLIDNFSILEKKGIKIRKDKNTIHSKYSKLNDKHDNNNQLVKIGQELQEILLNPLTTQESFKKFHRMKYEKKIRNHNQSRKYLSYHRKKSRIQKKLFLRGTSIKCFVTRWR